MHYRTRFQQHAHDDRLHVRAVSFTSHDAIDQVFYLRVSWPRETREDTKGHENPHSFPTRFPPPNKDRARVIALEGIDRPGPGILANERLVQQLRCAVHSSGRLPVRRRRAAGGAIREQAHGVLQLYGWPFGVPGGGTQMHRSFRRGCCRGRSRSDTAPPLGLTYDHETRSVCGCTTGIHSRSERRLDRRRSHLPNGLACTLPQCAWMPT